MSADTEIPSENAPRPARRSVGAVRSEESANAILDAAAEILSEGGNAAFTMEAVARRARAGKQTIYRWWPNRARLLLDVYHRQKGADGVNYQGGSAAEFERFIRELWVFWRETPAGRGFRLVVAESQTDPGAAEALADYFAKRRAEFIAAVAPPGADAEAVGTVHDMLIGFNLGRLLTGRLDDDPLPIAFVAMTLAHALAAAVE